MMACKKQKPTAAHISEEILSSVGIIFTVVLDAGIGLFLSDHPCAIPSSTDGRDDFPMYFTSEMYMA